MLDFTCRFSLFFLLFTALAAPSLAQPEGFAFVETLQSGEGRLDGINAIRVLPNGDFVVGGEFRGTKDFDPSSGIEVRSTQSTSTNNPFIARYTPSGSLVWVRHLRSGSSTELRSLDIDAAGNVYALGSFGDLLYLDESDLTQTLIDNPQPNADLWVASYTPNGDLRWGEAIGGDAVDSGTALTINGNSLVVCGVFGQTVDIDPGVGVFEVSTEGQGGQLTFVAAYQKDSGAFEWGFQISGLVFFDLINAVTRDTSGNLYITGAFRQAKDFDPSPDAEFILVSDGSNDDVFVASYTSTGDFRWARRAGDGGADFGRGVTWANGTVYATGEFRFTSVFEGDQNSETLVSAGNQDVFVAAYDDTTGELLDAFKLGSTGNDSGQGIRVVGDQLVVTGHYSATVDFNPNGAEQSFTATSLNGFLAAYAVGDLGLNWMSDIQSAGVSYVADVVESNGLLRAVGRFTNTTDFDPAAGEAIIVPVRNNDSDFFLVDYEAASGGFLAVHSGEDQLGGNVDVFGVAALNGGGAAAVGNFEGRLFVGNGDVIEASPDGGFIARYDATGNLLATARLQATTSVFMTSVKADANDDLFVTAYFTGDASFVHAGGELLLAANANQSRMVLLKLNANLELLWHKEFAGTLLQIASDVAVSETRIVLTGSFRGDLNIADGVVLSSAGTTDGFVASFLPDGSFEWAFRFGSTSLDSGERIAFDAAGNVLLAAQIRFTVNMDPSGAADPLTTSGSNTMVLASYTPQGNYQWANLQSTGATPRSLLAIDANRFAVYGSFSNTLALGSPIGTQSLTSLGSTDVFLAIFDNAGAIDTAYIVAGGASTDEAGALIEFNGQFHATGWVRQGGALLSTGATLPQWDVNSANGFYTAFSFDHEWSAGFYLGDESTNVEPTAIAGAAGELYVAGEFQPGFGEVFAFAGQDALIGRLGEPTTPQCAGDFDNDGIVAASDLLLLLAEFGCASSCSADLSGDGQTNVSDVLLFLSLFGTVCD